MLSRTTLLLACVASLVASSLPRASAQSYNWRTVEIGGCGFVTGTVFHPTEPGLVYARTDVGGAYRMDSTTNNRWIALNDDIGGINNEFQHLGVLTIGLDPNDANRVYIATGQYGGTESWKLASRIYRSTNRGATWTYTTPGFKMAGNGEGRGTGERMAVDPVNGANILVGTSDAGIWRSTDYGATWARLSGFPSTLTHLNFLLYAPAIAPGPGPNRRVYAAANTLTGQSFWFSDDNGTTWAEVPNHPGKTLGTEMMPLQGSFDAAGSVLPDLGRRHRPGQLRHQLRRLENVSRRQHLDQDPAPHRAGVFRWHQRRSARRRPRRGDHPATLVAGRRSLSFHRWRHHLDRRPAHRHPFRRELTLVVRCRRALDDGHRHRPLQFQPRHFQQWFRFDPNHQPLHFRHRPPLDLFQRRSGGKRAARPPQPHRRAAAGQRDRRLHRLPP